MPSIYLEAAHDIYILYHMSCLPKTGLLVVVHVPHVGILVYDIPRARVDTYAQSLGYKIGPKLKH